MTPDHSLSPASKEIWESYLATLDPQARAEACAHRVEAAIAGNLELADPLLQLYLDGKKTAGSSLYKAYEAQNATPPQVGDHWIILDSKDRPRCIAKTVETRKLRFADVPAEVARAEGEGDLSLDHWRKAHREFFTPYLGPYGIPELEEAEIWVEFFAVVWKSPLP